MSSDAIAAPASPTMFRIADLHESPFNERKFFDPAKLDELASNIKAEGVLQPLLVRPRIPAMFAGDPNAAAGHEVVFGHRRLRGAKLAGLEEVPCYVRVMSDAEAKSAQISENLQRENVNALEEAEALRSLMEEHDLSVADLIARTGKTKSYVYGRLKLLTLNEVSRKAFIAGDMQIEIALVLARMPSEKLQLDALAKIKSNHFESELTDGGVAGYRRVREFLHEHYMTDLKSALFKLDDAELLASAGACTVCPKRSGVTPELFSDVVEHKSAYAYSSRAGGENVCTDPDCFAEKKKLQLKREQAALEAKGQVVIAGNAARNAISASGEVKGAYIELSAVKDALKDKKSANIAIVTIQDPRTGKTKKAVKVADVKAAGGKVKEPAKKHDYEAERKKREAEEARRDEAWDIERVARRKLLDVTRAAIAAAPRTTFDLQVIARMAWNGTNWDRRSFIAELWGQKADALEKRIGSMTADEASRFMLDCAMTENVAGHSYLLDREPTTLLAFAKNYGVDITLARIGGLTPTPAAQAVTRAGSGKSAQKSTPVAAGTVSGRGPAQRVKSAAPKEFGLDGKEVKDDAADGVATPRPAAAGSPSGRAAKYRCPTTGQTWTGRGIMPAWLKAATAAGGKLSDFESNTEVKEKAASGGQGVKDDAGVAGEEATDKAGVAGRAAQPESLAETTE